MDIIDIMDISDKRYHRYRRYRIWRHLRMFFCGFRLQEASALSAQGTDSNSSAWQHPIGDANHVRLLQGLRHALDIVSWSKNHDIVVSKNTGTPKWMVYIMENPIQMDDLGVPLFLETPICRFNKMYANTKLYVFGRSDDQLRRLFQPELEASVTGETSPGKGMIYLQYLHLKHHNMSVYHFLCIKLGLT